MFDKNILTQFIMEVNDEKIIHSLLINENNNVEEVLHTTANKILNKLKNEFGDRYEILSKKLGSPDEKWSHDIKLRKGNKVGARLELNWENDSPTKFEIEIDESSILGSIITYSSLLTCLFLGAYLGRHNIWPLAFLPGGRISALLGILIAFVPGAIFMYILKGMIVKKEYREESIKLTDDIRKIILEL